MGATAVAPLALPLAPPQPPLALLAPLAHTALFSATAWGRCLAAAAPDPTWGGLIAAGAPGERG